MSIIVNNSYTGTTSDSHSKPMTCHTCKQKKTGVFGLDPNGRPRCFDCMPEADRAVFAQDDGDERPA